MMKSDQGNGALQKSDENKGAPAPFQYREIEGKLDIEGATKALVSLANNVKNTHTADSATRSAAEMQQLFRMRKSGIIALLDLIGEYTDQIPE